MVATAAYDEGIAQLLRSPARPLRACGACRGIGMRRGRRSGLRRCEPCEGAGIVPGVPEAALGSPKVAICGGGIAGLATALALQHRGIAATVFERDESFWSRPPGYGLTLQQGGRALRALGILDLVRDAGVWTGTHRSLASSGALLGVHGSGTRKNEKQHYAVHAPRQAVRAVLLSQLGSGTVRWAAPINTLPDFPVIVGADGIRSATRRAALDIDYPLRETGLTVVLGKGPPGARDVFEVVDGAARLYAMPYDRSNATMWQLSWPGESENLRESALAVVRGWSDAFPEFEDLVARTNDLTGYPIYDRDEEDLRTLPHRLPPNVVLMGDAAHPMCPFKAQGANQALLDAISFARRFATLPAPQAIASYYEDMVPRAAAKIAASRRAATLLHSEAALAPASRSLTRAAAAAAQHHHS
ncbi:hypothetical protein CTAYLR_004597 [Chrysophaeum taylorii]|uniref:FAD-dependent monooxygenase n=1 Tax=Chrysophaeum taylorii TaxID=2483200 RepID=A0AAD7UDV7_9STRA|nr:hypothetical protein CTAYLR_004597 [Chrysophaeum taylorii]